MLLEHEPEIALKPSSTQDCNAFALLDAVEKSTCPWVGPLWVFVLSPDRLGERVSVGDVARLASSASARSDFAAVGLSTGNSANVGSGTFDSPVMEPYLVWASRMRATKVLMWSMCRGGNWWKIDKCLFNFRAELLSFNRKTSSIMFADIMIDGLSESLLSSELNYCRSTDKPFRLYLRTL